MSNCIKCKHNSYCIYKNGEFCFPQMAYYFTGVFAPRGVKEACRLIDEEKERDNGHYNI